MAERILTVALSVPIVLVCLLPLFIAALALRARAAKHRWICPHCGYPTDPLAYHEGPADCVEATHDRHRHFADYPPVG
jgi:hypothetical protein